jgi:hypothetical protein
MGSFSVHHLVNPNYHPPSAALSSPPRRSLLPADYVDRLRLRMGLRSAAGDDGPRDWALDAGRSWGERSSVLFTATGVQERGPRIGGAAGLRGVSLAIRRADLAATAGDLPQQMESGSSRLDRLRGAAVRAGERDGSAWRAYAGTRAPTPGIVSRAPTYAGASLEAKPAGPALVSAGLLGFSAPAQAGGLPSPPPDSAGGHGATVWSASSWGTKASQFTVEMAAQGHDLDRRFRVALRPAVAFRGALGALALVAREQFSGPAYRLPSADGLRRAGVRLDQYDARVRLGRRAEAHVAAEQQAGGDPDLAGGAVTLGGSGDVSGPAVHVSAECAWSRRGPSAGDRRLFLQTSHTSTEGLSWLVHGLHSWSPGTPARFQVQTEVSRAARAVRLGLESRLDWMESAVSRGALSFSVSCPLPIAGASLWASLGTAAERERGFRPGLSEAALRLTFAPGARDRLEMSAERASDAGFSSLQAAAEYTLEAPRYPADPGAPGSSAKGWRVEARVEQADSRSGVGNALVTLDGREYRFTDAEGRVTFEGVVPGPHELAVEEGSLPAGERAVAGAHLSFSVESSHAPEPLVFEVGRPELRKRF